MGMTNIHSAEQVLCRAGCEMDDQALIAYFNKCVLLIGRSFVQEEVDAFADVLNTPYQGMWVKYNGIEAPTPSTNDRAVPIPALYTSPGLREPSGIHARSELPKSPSGNNIELAFVIIVRGASGALFSKVRIFYSYFAVAAGIMEEAVQGLCVVFSAAMLKRDVRKLGQHVVRFKKMESLGGLVKSAEDESVSDLILLCC